MKLMYMVHEKGVHGTQGGFSCLFAMDLDHLTTPSTMSFSSQLRSLAVLLARYYVRRWDRASKSCLGHDVRRPSPLEKADDSLSICHRIFKTLSINSNGTVSRNILQRCTKRLSIVKLESLGTVKQDWEIFGIIFSHMEQQCEECRQVVVKLHDKLSTNDNALTLKGIEAISQQKKSVHRIGTENRGAPIKAPRSMNKVPTIPAADAKPIAHTVREVLTRYLSPHPSLPLGSCFKI